MSHKSLDSHLFFPNDQKLAEFMPAFKKDDLIDKENYRQIILLSHTSKMYKKVFFNQINDYIEPYIFRPPERFSEKLQYTTLLKKFIKKWKDL